MSEEKIKDLLKYRFNIVPVYLNTQNIQEGVPQLVSKELALKHVLIPFKQSSFRLLVAMADPFDAEAIEEIQKVTGLTVLPRKAEADEIISMIEHFYTDEATEESGTEEEAAAVDDRKADGKAGLDFAEPEITRDNIFEEAELQEREAAENSEAIKEIETLREIEAIKKAEEKELLKRLAESEKSEQAKETEENSDNQKYIKEPKKTEGIVKKEEIEEINEIEETEKADEIREIEKVRDIGDSHKEVRQPVKRISFRDKILGINRLDRKQSIAVDIESAPENETENEEEKASEIKVIKNIEEKASETEAINEEEKASETEAIKNIEEKASEIETINNIEEKASKIEAISVEDKASKVDAEVVLEAVPAPEISAEVTEEEPPAGETAEAEEEITTVSEKQAEQSVGFQNDLEIHLEEIKSQISRTLQEQRYKRRDAKSIMAQDDSDKEEEINNEEEIKPDLEKDSIGIIESPAIDEEPQESEKKSDEAEQVGAILVGNELRQDQVQPDIMIQKKAKQKIGEFVVDKPVLDEDEFVRTLSKQTGIPSVKLNQMVINPDIPTLIKEALARKHMLIPIKIEKGQLHVAMADPLNVYAIDDVKIATGFTVVPLVAGKKDIIRAIDQYYGQLTTEEAIEDLMKEMDTDTEEVHEKEVLNTINNAPLVRLVNSLLRQAVTMKASDVHIEPFEGIVRVRFRIDGDLQEIMNLDINTHPAVVARIKIMGKMNIAERRVPQDGRVEIRVEDRMIDLRLSTLPTTFGEKVVIRILDREGATFNRKKLGFSREALERLDTVIHNSCGIILVTGPTGSGKSSTLYTILTELNKINLNIITVEDPIEYRMAGVNQVQVNHKAGLDFANGLRSILRQDPDIIMVGEIRDTETVQIAVRAAITGHLVLSTIHTNDTASTISRLIDMGVEPYLISSSLVGIIAQRLVKKICPDCKTEYHPNDFEKLALGLPQDAVTYKGKGCLSCNNTGYSGRTAIAEIMDINYEIKKMINERRSIEEIKEHALKRGMISLQDSCRKLVLQGVTTVDEYFRNAYVVE